MNVGISALTSFMMAGGPSGLKETLEGGGSVMDFATTFGAGETAKMSLYDWMGKSGAEKAASGFTDVSYFEYLLGMDNKDLINPFEIKQGFGTHGNEYAGGQFNLNMRGK